MTPEYQKQIQIAAQCTWDQIGFDVLQASGISSDSGKCLRRSTVIEVVLDHIHNYNENRPRANWLDFTEFNGLSYNKQIALLKQAFPYKDYGY